MHLTASTKLNTSSNRGEVRSRAENLTCLQTQSKEQEKEVEKSGTYKRSSRSTLEPPCSWCCGRSRPRSKKSSPYSLALQMRETTGEGEDCYSFGMAVCKVLQRQSGHVTPSLDPSTEEGSVSFRRFPLGTTQSANKQQCPQ